METDLPIASAIDDLQDALSRGDAVLEAPPGSGKTTIAPLALLEAAWLGHRKIVMLEPRRIAARAAAHRMASLLGEEAGQTVGYRMRLETRVSAQTKIEVITEGILTRMLQSDPSLDDVGLVIFDEFHERSLDADLALALCLKGREIFREPDAPLRVLVMSATLEQGRIATLLGDAPVVRAEGRQYPVDIEYMGASRRDERIAGRVTTAVLQAITKHPTSSILAFLPGQGEISQCRDELDAALRERGISGISIKPLFGNLTISEQSAAIAPMKRGRKVVLATNIAESSLTIDGVDVVIDSGLAREPVYDPVTALTRLTTRRISRASSEQRAGRAGRQCPGTCYRLWSRTEQDQLEPHGAPEILSADLTSLALTILEWGATDPGELPFLDAPPRGAWLQAIDLLVSFGAIQAQRLTSLGERLAALPLHPRLAVMLVRGAEIGEASSATLLASVLSDRDPMSQDDPDMTHRLDVLTGRLPCPGPHRGWLNRTKQLASQYASQLARQDVAVTSSLDAEKVPGYLIACAYPDRIARRRHAGGYQLANGRTANLAAQHYLGKSRWLAVAEVGGLARRKGDIIRAATSLNESLFDTLLAHEVKSETVVEWDRRENRFIAEARRSIGAIVLARTTLTDIPIEEKRLALCELVRREGLDIFNWPAELTQWRARVELVRRTLPDAAFPAMDDETLLATLEEWLAPWLDNIRTKADFARLDLAAILHARLSWQAQRDLDVLAPPRWRVPSGSSHRIDYTSSPPVLAVKLQEMFGAEDTPTVVQGRVPLVVHLLSPAGRPLQVTQDLAGFWRSSYHDVKKDMKGRYPKHPWPDDPLTALPTARTKSKSP
ncbi:MAG: ATP-dependent helicase HrpB [Pseudomonadales bacterium]|nr:ATP-dependent helicase HrpB [Pseudomonadales bacterium]